MSIALKKSFSRLSFSRQFMLAIAAVLLVGMAVIGNWLERQIESSEVHRAAAISAVYVESIFAAQLHEWSGGEVVDSETHAVLDRVFAQGPLQREVLRFKLWDTNGRIVYSSDDEQIGKSFPLGGQLAAALAGTVQARISDLDEADNQPEHLHWPQLLEVYVPIRSATHGRIIAVAEFYLSMENLGRDIRTAQQHSWLLVVAATAAIYLLLLSLVRRANDTILDQQRDLRHQLDQLRAALDENDRMREQLREAGASTTALNEEFLHRVAADLHDGPAQAIAFALMRFDELGEVYCGATVSQGDAAQDLRAIREALNSSLRDVRNIASGLAIPGIAELSLADTARRAVRDFERMSRQTVEVEIVDVQDDAPLAIKIAVYRLLQESLANGWRHSPGAATRVSVQQNDAQLVVEVVDQGAGFDPHAAAMSGRLGLAFMRERVRLLGGIFEIDSTPGSGTCIRARLPLPVEEATHA